MSVIRKYNSKTKEWEVVAASSASQISVRSESLLDENQKETNVESVLQKFGQDINTLKGNVSWLAEHGGGGSGPGGGGGTIDAEIKVNGQESGANIVLDSSGLNIVVQAKTSGLKWSITIATDTQIIKTVNSTSKTTVSTDELDKLGISNSFNLSITAFNESTLTNVYWNGRIQRATVTLSTLDEVSFKYLDLNKSQIVYNYSVGVLGTYVLYINDIQIGDPYVFKYLKGDLPINLSDIVDAGINLQVGNNTLTAYLQSAQTPEIISQKCNSRIILTAETPIISCPSLSEDQNNRSTIYINPGQNTVLLMPFTVYYTSGTFKVQIYSDPSEKVDWDSITTFSYYNTLYENASYTITTQELNKDIQFTIEIKDSKSQIEYRKTFYGITQQPEYDLLEHGVTPIFSFQTFFGSISNNQWKQQNAILTIKNPNINSSEIQVKDNISLRLQNAAYGVIQNTGSQSYWYDYYTDAIKQFTLSICYKADFHPDDDRTILQFAQTNTEHTPSSGIIIRDHKLYIAQNTFDLEDQELMNITITYKQVQNTNQGNVFVYINGVVEAVFENINVASLIPSTENKIYIAAQVENDKEMYYTDVSIYRVSLYNKCLDPLQVLYDYLNDQSLTNLVGNSYPNSDLINDGLRRNFITTNENKQHKSLLYNTDEEFDNNNENFNGNFLFSNLVSTSGTNAEIKGDIQNYSVPIPLMLIDISKSNDWTWTNFITPRAPISKVQNCSFQYYDQNNSNQSIIKGSCDVDIQGTSTLADAIKNLQITFSDNTIFVPKETWFPEQNYTLKADIVDSSHSINASIGKFVNEEFGLSYNSDGSLANTESWYPFANTVKESFIQEKQRKGSPIQKYFPKATLKHGVEGFPMFLILRFKGESASDTGLHSMGIYQFILGRQSPRNLGYEVINSISGIEDNNITYPYYAEGVNIGVNVNKGYWIEMNKNESFSISDKFQEKNDLSNAALTGLFWQADENGVYYDEVAQIKYTNMGNDAVSSVTGLEPFKKFIRNVIALPVTNRRYCVSGNSELLKHTFFNSTYPIYESKMTTEGIQWTKKEGNNQLLNQGDDLADVLSELNIESYSQYFVIAMFFGLIDNFMKNMPLKFYQTKDGQWEVPLLGIYDTDTGMGGDNEGELKVSESVWLSTLENVNGVVQETSSMPDDPKTSIIGQNNKLWYFDSDAVNYSKNYGKGGSLFTAKWHSFIRCLKNKYANTEYAINTLEDIVTLYYNKYFLAQTEGCGELLFNLTYFTKYLNKYQNQGTLQNQASKLHGRRQQQVRKWMKNRVKFLDSVYTALGTNVSMGSDATITITSVNANISSGSIPSFKLTSNYPIISKVAHQGSNDIFVILNENANTQVAWGASSPTTQTVSHDISYSDAIQNLGDAEQTLKDIYFEKVSSGALPYLTIFNASNCEKLSTTSDATACFTYNGKSELREINLSNTAKNKSINYVLNLTSGYSKLQKLNLYNSCVSKIELPQGNDSIPLLLLDIRYSQLTSLDLKYQNLLTDLDLTGCNKLATLSIGNCDKLQSLTLNASQSNLKTVEINSDTFRTLECTNNDSIQTIEVVSSNLTSVDLTGCSKLTSISISGNSLESLILDGCESLTEINIINPKDTIQTLSLRKTKVKCIKYNNEAQDNNVIDLRVFKSIGRFDIRENNKVEYIQFTNDQNAPIDINVGFYNQNLKRVYGNLKINVDQVFMGCTNFSILGPEREYLGINMVDSSGRVKFFTEVTSIISNGKPKFQSGARVTNLNFAISSGQGNFQKTSCTLLDVYYVFYNIGNLTDCSNMFQNIPTLELGWTETCDNSLNRNTFINCGNVISLKSCFYGCSMNPFRIFSPDHDDNSVLDDNGLFSPLVNCTGMSLIFNGEPLYGDRFQFRRKSDNYKISNLDYWNISLAVDNVNNLSSPPDISYLGSNYSTIGNFNSYFANLPNILSLSRFAQNTQIINYDLTDQLSCPATSYSACFISTYATGDIKLKNLFRFPSKVISIRNSFVGTGDSNSDTVHGWLDRATFKVTEDILKDFTNLQYWGYEKSGDFRGSISTVPFSGSEIIRSIDSTDFPYGIFSANRELIWVEGFFKDIVADQLKQVVELPSVLFINNSKLESVIGLFYNSQFTFRLTSDGFANCPNLKNVAYMFYNSGVHIQGSIPKRLFYHGGFNRTVKYTGANLWNEQKTEYRYDPTLRGEDGNQVGISSEDLQTIQFTYFVPNTNIVDMQYCFYNCRLDAYSNTTPSIENNPDYLPLTHIIVNGTVIKANYNDLEKTIIWEYDGVTIPEGYQGENLDEPYDLSRSAYDIQFCNDKTITTTLNYMCPPDLLRYCTNSTSTSIKGLFCNCGHQGGNGGWAYMTPQIVDYGIKGRIVPYLLKPVSQVTDLQEMFKNCKLLSTYTTEEDISYLIPKTFFKYAPRVSNLYHAFYGTTYPANISLNVFSQLTQALNITGIFWYCRFNGTSDSRVNISQLFTNKIISSLERAFSVNGSAQTQDANNIKRDQYITFSDNFTKNKIAKDADKYVFDGYNANTVIFANKSLEDRNDNYRTT